MSQVGRHPRDLDEKEMVNIYYLLDPSCPMATLQKFTATGISPSLPDFESMSSEFEM